jgi:hypothetical protein
MRVLVACEYSGRVREAFRKLGHDAWSCDLYEDAEDNSPHHYKQCVFDVLGRGHWDLMIAHPPCTYLSNSGAKHLYIGGKKANGRDEQRWKDMRSGADFFNRVLAAPVAKKCLENPVMHGHAQKLVGGKATQYVQPWWFGEPFFKATGFRLIGLPPLVATNKLVPPKKGTKEHKKWSAIHMASPGPNRQKDRSRTFQGVADAMAEQWGK